MDVTRQTDLDADREKRSHGHQRELESVVSKALRMVHCNNNYNAILFGSNAKTELKGQRGEVPCV